MYGHITTTYITPNNQLTKTAIEKLYYAKKVTYIVVMWSYLKLPLIEQ